MKKNMESRRSFFQKSIASTIGLIVAPAILKSEVMSREEKSPALPVEPIWRNRQDDMKYRMLGRTGMMVSEIVLGTYGFDSKDRFPLLEMSIERGVNYFDTAFAYSQGEVENTLGEFFRQNGNREKVFLSTKLSAYYGMVDRFVKEILAGLPGARQESLRKKAEKMVEDRTVKRPGYHINFFNGQEKQIDQAYLRYIVLKEYGYKKEWKDQIKKNAHKLLEGSLKRLQTDYVDVLHCPHGSGMPEMMDDILEELFSEFKQRGLVRASAASFHNDVGGNLDNARKVGFYDLAMFAYNIANHAALEKPIYDANQAGMGLIAMKVAKLFSMEDQPGWRKDKLNTAIPSEDLSIFAKAYTWALQNPNLSCCVSQMETEQELADNLQAIGRNIELQSV